MATGYFSHQDCQRHEMQPHHPESPERLAAISNRLRQGGLMQQLQTSEVQPIGLDALALAHGSAYVQRIQQQAPMQGMVQLDPDTALCSHSWRAACLAAGAGVQAVHHVINGTINNAFCAVRPPGHHAELQTPMGFCIFNNIAVAALTALQMPNIERIAIVDFDVHHGNGTVDIFKDDPRVLVASTFQHPFYPFRFTDLQRDNIVNCPLDEGSNGDAFKACVERLWLPALETHRPQFIFISAGFDAHKDDPLGGLKLVEDDYRWVTGLITDIARQYAQGRVVSMLEGGYNLTALASSVEAHIETLLLA